VTVQGRYRNSGRYRNPLPCGSLIHSFDNDYREGRCQEGRLWVGTLGCFVEMSDGSAALLSNNHVIAGCNRGRRGSDRIFQPANYVYDPGFRIALLHDFVELHAVTSETRPSDDELNSVDAAIAKLEEGIEFRQAYLPSDPSATLRGIASVNPGDQVSKIGCRTAHTLGTVVRTDVEVGPVWYVECAGYCWFRRSFLIEGINGQKFADHGDSGSAIVNTEGEVVGLLYAVNSGRAAACPIDAVLQSLACALA